MFEISDAYEENVEQVENRKTSSLRLLFRRLSTGVQYLLRPRSDESLGKTSNTDTISEGTDDFEGNDFRQFVRSQGDNTSTSFPSDDDFFKSVEDDLVQQGQEDSEHMRPFHRVEEESIPKGEIQPPSTPQPSNTTLKRPRSTLTNPRLKRVTITKMIDIEVAWDETIEDVLHRLFDQEELIPNPRHPPYLIYDHEVLSTQQKISEVNLSRGAKLQLVMRA